MPALFVRPCPQNTIWLESDFTPLTFLGIEEYKVQMGLVALDFSQLVGHVLASLPPIMLHGHYGFQLEPV